MKNHLLKVSIYVFIIASLLSCRQDNLSESGDATENNTSMFSRIGNERVVDGRLYFPNKEALEQVYGLLINSDYDSVAAYIDEKDFISLRPMVTESNEELIYYKTKERLSSLKMNNRFIESEAGSQINDIESMIEEIDKLENIIADDTFGALLNSDGEIQVGGKIYKYTDVGIFEIDVENYRDLLVYLEQNNIADNFLYLTSESIQNQFISLYPTDIMSPVDGVGGISFYPGTIGNPPNYSPNNPAVNPPVTDPNTQMANFINSLQNCDTYSTWLQGLFGDTNMCTDKYEDRRRVKTKAYNSNYYLVYHLGAKVKHQYRGWTGFWRKEDADEIRLGVLTATFAYDYASYFNPTPGHRTQYVFNGGNRLHFDANTYWSPNFHPGLYTMTSYSIQSYPTIFKDDFFIEDILPINFSSPNPNIDYGLYAALQAGNSQLTASSLNNLFWGQTMGVVKQLGDLYASLGQPKPNNNITYTYNAPPLSKMMVAKTKYKHHLNADDAETTFDWGFQLSFKIGNDGAISPSISTPSMKKPEDYKVIMYGIAKKNGAWHGTKMNTGIHE